MKLAKTRLKCTMEVEFLRGCLKLYIEKELYASITTDEIRESYDFAVTPRANFKLIHM
jgi:hypothetical protein